MSVWRFKFKLRGNYGSISEVFEKENDGMKRYDELIKEGLDLDGFEIDVVFDQVAIETNNPDTALHRLLSKGLSEYDHASFGPSEDEIKLASILGLELRKPTFH